MPAPCAGTTQHALFPLSKGIDQAKWRVVIGSTKLLVNLYLHPYEVIAFTYFQNQKCTVWIILVGES